MGETYVNEVEQQAGMLIELEKLSRTDWEYNRAEEFINNSTCKQKSLLVMSIIS